MWVSEVALLFVATDSVVIWLGSVDMEAVEVLIQGDTTGEGAAHVMGAGFKKRRFRRVVRPEPKTFTQYWRLGKHSTITPILFHRARRCLLLWMRTLVPLISGDRSWAD